MGSSAPSSVAGSDLDSDSDSDSDGQGGAEMYDEEEEDVDEEGSEECDEFEARGGDVGGEAKAVADEVVAAPEDEGCYEEEAEADEVVAAPEDEGCYEEETETEGEADVEAAVEGVEVVKKGSEPHAVPKTGAFDMHDDRFPDLENGRQGSKRNFSGGRKLWYPKDDHVWAHDRFYEINFHSTPNGNGRRPRAPFRAWGGVRTHGFVHGYLERTLSRSYYHDNREEYKYVPEESYTLFASTKDHKGFPKEPNTFKFYTHYDDTKNFVNVRRESHAYYGNAKGFNNAPGSYRGRVSRTYRPHWRIAPEIYSGQYIRSQNEEASSNADVGKHPSQTLGLPHSSLKQQSRAVYRVKAVPSGRGNTRDSLCTSSTEDIDNAALNSSVSTLDNCSQYSKSSDQGTGLNFGEPTKNILSSTTSQAIRSYAESNNAVYQERSIHRPVQSTPRVPTQIFCQKLASTNKIQSHATRSDEDDMSTGSVNSLVSSAVKGLKEEEVKGASFTYDGGHVCGDTRARGLTLGDKGFIGPPALFPVMQFSGQHPSESSAPSIGMTLHGFVAQQQFGGSSEISQMTWLSSATGALGETYNPPYFGSNYPQPFELMSSLVSPRDNSVAEVPVPLISQEIPDVVGHQPIQGQNKTRRYSEMNFASLT
ncbi:hypothetical protein ABZP36_016101 [Zizania latifolia]